MGEALRRARHVGAEGFGEGRFDAAEHEVAAHPGREVEDDVDVRGADPLDDLR